MGKSFAFTVPSVPDPVLSPNTTAHWGKKHKAKKQMQSDWAAAVSYQKAEQRIWTISPLFTGSVICTIAVYWPPNRRSDWDKDNLTAAFKAGIDALEIMGVVGNDNQIDQFIITQQKDPERRGRVEVTLEEA